MLKSLTPSWDGIFRWSRIGAFVFAGLAATSAFISGWVGAKLSAETKKEFNIKLVEANTKALEAQLALEKFKAPRVLSEEQQASIGEKVSSFVGQRVSIGAIPTAFEHVALAEMISQALHKGGLTPNFNQGAAEMHVGPTKGVVARYVTGNDRGKTFAEILASALRDEGIAAGAVPDMMKSLIKQEEVNVEGHSWVVIVVGEKP